MWTGSRLRMAAALPAAAALALGAATPAAAAPPASGEKLVYQFTLRAAPVETYTHFFRELVQAAGFSRVQLSHGQGDVTGQARALGATVWPLTDEEPCLLGCEPPCPESTVVNPTIARTSAPRECNDRVPGIAASGLAPEFGPLVEGVVPQAVAETPDGHTATGSSSVGDQGRGADSFGGAGSISTARVTEFTGRLLASARSFVTDLRLPGGDLASVTSLLEVTASPGELPKVSYLLSIAGAGDNANRSSLDQANFTISGRRIPITDYVSAVNESLANVSSQLRILAGLGVRVLAPTEEFTDGEVRFRVNSPVLMVGAEPGVQLPTPTRDAGLRIGAAMFEGSYGTPDPVLR